MANLELFYFDSCPFCQHVLMVINQLDLKVTLSDIMNSIEKRSQLINDTGRKTVPCLYIDGRPMFESQDIIKWLKDNVNNLEKNA